MKTVSLENGILGQGCHKAGNRFGPPCGWRLGRPAKWGVAPPRNADIKSEEGSGVRL
jgi:hypothetical protein